MCRLVLIVAVLLSWLIGMKMGFRAGAKAARLQLLRELGKMRRQQ